jgi:hypothetical protein
MTVISQCILCGKEIHKKRPTKKYCSGACRNKTFFQRRANLDFERKYHALRESQLLALSELDTLKEQNVALQKENDKLKAELDMLKQKPERDDYPKSIINRYKEIADKGEAEMDRLTLAVAKSKLSASN